MPRIQTYLDDEVYELLKAKAHESQSSISQVSGQAIVDGIQKKSTSVDLQLKKVTTMLEYVLCSVHDVAIAKTNQANVEKLIKLINESIT
jgi:hypothetical protein